MNNWEKSVRDRRNRLQPSFSSTLLDKIYRSIDDAEPNTTVKKQSKAAEDQWMEHNSNAKEKTSLRQHFSSELDKKYSMLDHDYDHHDALFFSSGSNSNSSASSSGALSSSDAESFYNPKPTSSCFSRPRPIRVRSEKPQTRAIEDHHFSSATEQRTPKSKSRVSRMYGNLKQPISPGGRLAAFVNSFFTGNAKKSKNPVPRSTCSSASSFSRSCLSKNSPAASLCNADKRSVQFKDLRPREQIKSLYREREEPKQISVSVPSSRKDDAGLKLQAMEKNKDFLKHYHQTQNDHEQEEEDDDDDASCASSDLFELDHLAVIGEKYSDELPVYATTRVDRNRVISNIGLYL